MATQRSKLTSIGVGLVPAPNYLTTNQKYSLPL
nr:MAG TPA: hypothetical protein [Crassvirales sp.]